MFQQKGSEGVFPAAPLVNGWIAKGGPTAVDVLSVKQAKACLHTLDTEIKWYHIDGIDSLVDDGEVEREQAIMDEYKSRVAHIYLLASKNFLLLPSLQSRQKARK